MKWISFPEVKCQTETLWWSFFVYSVQSLNAVKGLQHPCDSHEASVWCRYSTSSVFLWCEVPEYVWRSEVSVALHKTCLIIRLFPAPPSFSPCHALDWISLQASEGPLGGNVKWVPGHEEDCVRGEGPDHTHSFIQAVLHQHQIIARKRAVAVLLEMNSQPLRIIMQLKNFCCA